MMNTKSVIADKEWVWSVAVDVVIFALRSHDLQVYLIQRTDHPGYWSLPGGIVRADDQDFLSIGPGDGTGAVRRITFDDSGEPSAPEVMADDLDFPDGIGILVPR